jgi:hypothetical protein
MSRASRYFCVLMSLFALGASPLPSSLNQAEDPNPPQEIVKLIFIHHSTGENWLTDGYGDLGQTLDRNNYFVSDTNYGWGPDAIGDRTDIPNWTEWFASADTPTYMNALFNENGQHSSYTRTLPDPGGENQIVMFKSCFPNSALEGNPNDPPGEYEELSVGGAKYVYNTILEYFASRPDKLFVVITAPPLSDPTYAANARAFNQWLVNDWLRENNYTLHNVAVFDFYNVLTSPQAHHRFHNGAVEHVIGNSNTLHYPSGDDHPSEAGSRKATEEFVTLLNVFYHRWQADAPPQSAPAPASAPETQPEPPAAAQSSGPGGLIDDFEGGAVPSTSGWESYFEDNTDTELNCAKDTILSHSGSGSLQFEFDVAANSWATCGFYFDTIQNWRSGDGISFYLRADRAGLPYDVDLFGGAPGGRTTYIYRGQTPAQSVDGWSLVEIRWEEILRADWEENPGTSFDPAEVTGFAFGLSTPEQSRLNGTLWVDDLSLLGAANLSVAQPESDQPAAGESPRRPSLPCIGALAWPVLLLAGTFFRRQRSSFAVEQD